MAGGVISTGSIPKLLWPGMNAVWGMEYKDHEQEWRDLFEVETSDKNYEEDVLLPGFGLAPVKAEGASISYDTTQQGYTSRYTNVAYGLGFILTREEIDDNLYKKAALNRTSKLARSFKQTKENVGANVYNRGFDANYPGGDGVALISNAHPTQTGNQSNRPVAYADLSEASLEDLTIQIMNAVDDRGLKIALMPQTLHIPPALTFEATRILASQLQNDTGNNAINALKSQGIFPGGVKVNHYFTDTDAWFIRTDCPDSMKAFNRTEAEFAQDNDFDTSNLKYKGYSRFVMGFSDWRGAWGSSGA